jgi:hypothetical protein
LDGGLRGGLAVAPISAVRRKKNKEPNRETIIRPLVPKCQSSISYVNLQKFPTWRIMHYMEFQNEHDFQNWAVARLRRLGYLVTVTSSNSPGKRQHRALADTLIHHPSWQKGMNLAAEFKKPGKWKYSSPEQEEAHQLGVIVVFDSWLGICDTLGLEYSEQDNLL